jgi:PEP-CTERM motif
VKRSALAVATALGLAVVSGQAKSDAVIDITQVGGDVVATASGAIDLTGLTQGLSGIILAPGFVSPADGEAVVGANGASFDEYSGVSGPASFGPGSFTPGSSGSGGPIGVDESSFNLIGQPPVLIVPLGYVSGTALSGSSTFDGQTIASLGLTPGTYVYTWGGSAAQGDSLTVKIRSIPEPSTWAMMLMGFAGLGLAGYRATRKGAAAKA